MNNNTIKTAYQTDKDGYLVGQVTCYNNRVPAGAVTIAPENNDGFIPRWDGEKWEQIENNKGKEGYVNGVKTEIKEYGPLPEGFTTEYVKTPEELYQEKERALTYQLDKIDKKVVRPLMLIIDNEANDTDKAIYQRLKSEKQALQTELKELQETEQLRLKALAKSTNKESV